MTELVDNLHCQPGDYTPEYPQCRNLDVLIRFRLFERHSVNRTIESGRCQLTMGSFIGEQPVETGRAKRPLSRGYREIRIGRSLALPNVEFFIGILVTEGD